MKCPLNLTLGILTEFFPHCGFCEIEVPDKSREFKSLTLYHDSPNHCNVWVKLDQQGLLRVALKGRGESNSTATRKRLNKQLNPA